jgi:hypothetical protein
MANRILRLDTSAQNLQRLAGFLRKKINIVQNDNTVLLAELLQISGTTLRVQNMRRQELTVNFTDIYEIIIDHND